jgi:hypothetical protein
MNDFEHRAQEIIDSARQQRLNVLIWGPGDPGESGTPNSKKSYDKRCLIRKELRENFPRAEVKFSEELKEELKETITIRGTIPQETVHAASADLVIILDISRGADLELDHFAKYSWFRKKVWLLVPQKYLDTAGLVAEVFNLIPKGQRQGFTDEQFERCDVAKQMSVDIVMTVAALKLLET